MPNVENHVVTVVLIHRPVKLIAQKLPFAAKSVATNAVNVVNAIGESIKICK